MIDKSVEQLIQGLRILIVDGNAYMRGLTRMMLMNLGARTTLEASDGLAALEQIRASDPDVMLLEWEMPLLDGSEVMRIVRSPSVFPRPNLPIIMLSQLAYRSSVLRALRLGAHEFLVKPTSPNALRDRLLSILLNPRAMRKMGDFYVPEPRRIRSADELGLLPPMY